MKSDLRTSNQQDPGHRMVEKNEAVQLAKDLGQYIIYKVTCDDLTFHYRSCQLL